MERNSGGTAQTCPLAGTDSLPGFSFFEGVLTLQKIIIADASADFTQGLLQALERDFQVTVCRSGRETLNAVHNQSPDLLVLDLMLPEIDGLGLLEILQEEGIRPAVMVLTRILSPYVADNTARLGISYVMMKPCDLADAAHRIRDLLGHLQGRSETAAGSRRQVTELLMEMGIPAKLSGYSFVREAVLMMAAKPGLSITKELYPAVAQSCGVSVNVVERSIRTAIASGWEKGGKQAWQRHFAPEDTTPLRPSNGAFIAGLAELLETT